MVGRLNDPLWVVKATHYGSHLRPIIGISDAPPISFWNDHVRHILLFGAIALRRLTASRALTDRYRSSCESSAAISSPIQHFRYS